MLNNCSFSIHMENILQIQNNTNWWHWHFFSPSHFFRIYTFFFYLFEWYTLKFHRNTDENFCSFHYGFFSVFFFVFFVKYKLFPSFSDFEPGTFPTLKFVLCWNINRSNKNCLQTRVITNIVAGVWKMVFYWLSKTANLNVYGIQVYTLYFKHSSSNERCLCLFLCVSVRVVLLNSHQKCVYRHFFVVGV